MWADRWGGFFGPLRNLTGVENLCTLFYDDPDLIEEMMDADADYIVGMMSQILDVVHVDCFQYWEDMAYNAGPLLSPSLARKYMLPRSKRVNEYLRGRGVRFIGLDSDGKIDNLIPIWVDSGINYLFPFEVQCGMDVLAVRKEYGRDLRMVGGVDKRALKYGHAAIDAELERVCPLIEEGGYIPMLDHTVPPDVSFERLSLLCQAHERGLLYRRSAMITVTQNQVAEWSFSSEKAYDDPFNQVELSFVFEDEQGAGQTVPAFWAGGDVWRVRFSSPKTGRFRFESVCSDADNADLHGVVGECQVMPYQGDNPLYLHGPITISDDRRYFQHTDGTPFFWLGDTWWMGLCGSIDWPGFQWLCYHRAKTGFNVGQIVAGLYPGHASIRRQRQE